MLMLSIITGIILFVGVTFAVIDYKEKFLIWLVVALVFTIIFACCLGLYLRQKDQERRVENMNACQSIGGKYIVVGQEKVMVGKILRTVDVYGCVK